MTKILKHGYRIETSGDALIRVTFWAVNPNWTPETQDTSPWERFTDTSIRAEYYFRNDGSYIYGGEISVYNLLRGSAWFVPKVAEVIYGNKVDLCIDGVLSAVQAGLDKLGPQLYYDPRTKALYPAKELHGPTHALYFTPEPLRISTLAPSEAAAKAKIGERVGRMIAFGTHHDPKRKQALLDWLNAPVVEKQDLPLPDTRTLREVVTDMQAALRGKTAEEPAPAQA